MPSPTYSPIFKKCLREYSQANYQKLKLEATQFKQTSAGSLALGLALGMLPSYLFPIMFPIWNMFFSVIFLLSSSVASGCGMALLLSYKKLQKLQSKEFMAYAVLDELCVVSDILYDKYKSDAL